LHLLRAIAGDLGIRRDERFYEKLGIFGRTVMEKLGKKTRAETDDEFAASLRGLMEDYA